MTTHSKIYLALLFGSVLIADMIYRKRTGAPTAQERRTFLFWKANRTELVISCLLWGFIVIFFAVVIIR